MKTPHFNQMTPKEQELLVCLVEEAAETVMAVAKALRHGLNSMHPDVLAAHIAGDMPALDNRFDIAREAGQFVGVLDRLAVIGVLDGSIIRSARETKLKDSAPYLHHQGDSS